MYYALVINKTKFFFEHKQKFCYIQIRNNGELIDIGKCVLSHRDFSANLVRKCEEYIEDQRCLK